MLRNKKKHYQEEMVVMGDHSVTRKFTNTLNDFSKIIKKSFDNIINMNMELESGIQETENDHRSPEDFENNQINDSDGDLADFVTPKTSNVTTPQSLLKNFKPIVSQISENIPIIPKTTSFEELKNKLKVIKFKINF